MSSPDDVTTHAVQIQPTNEEYDLHKMKLSPLLLPHTVQIWLINEEYDLHKMKSAPLLLIFFQTHKNQKRWKREYAWIYNISYLDGLKICCMYNHSMTL